MDYRPEPKINSRFEATVITADGSMTIVHPEHGETFHSHQGARFEAEALYVDGSGLRQDLDALTGGGINVLDVGLGLGYNAVGTISAWCLSSGARSVHLCSLEFERDLVRELLSGQAKWMKDWPRSWLAPLEKIGAWPSPINDQLHIKIVHPNNSDVALNWQIQIGDAFAANLQPPAGCWNYIWQDPFSPRHNPPMWSAEWFRKLRPYCDDSTKMMTYSVARQVRDAMTAAGFAPERFSAAGQAKRHWLRSGISPAT